ncbi:uncharacterized protein LOC113074883 [Carassius auratus]|uniref:Uncharacterized protein LOC113074883 n=1 Tax=Carassius auratus TaxID=7957 RepID=A0A6P6N327_CARAU|nr:uncharacterized protein LOC113074883 [Carassius auratus]
MATQLQHYVLNDKFHEDNSKDERDALRKIGLVAQLAGKVNSQAAEQFFSKLKKNNDFLNMTLPSTHVFLMRSIIHHHNSQKNLRRLEAFKKLFGTEVVLNVNHQAVLAVSESSTQSGAKDVCQVTNLSGSKATVDLPDFDAPVTGMETSADVNMEEVDEDMIGEDADEYSAQPWMKPQNLLQDKFVVVHVFTINAKTYCPQ